MPQAASRTPPLSPKAGRRPLVLVAGMGNSGQYNPLFSVASTFARLNPDVRVVFACWQSKEAEIRASGMEFLLAWPFASDAAPGQSDDPVYHLDKVFNASGPRNANTLLYWTHVSRSQSLYGDALAILQPWMEEHKPDLAICDILSEASMAAAIMSGTPFVVNAPVPPLVLLPTCKPSTYPPIASGVSRLPQSFLSRLWNMGIVTVYGLNMLRKIYPVLKRHANDGIPLPSQVGEKALLVLYNTASKLSDPRLHFPPKVEFTGAVMRPEDAQLADPDTFQTAWSAELEQAQRSDEEAYELYRWVDQATQEGKPIVFIGLGTIYKLDVERVQAIYNALESLPVQVVWKLSVDEQGLLPPHAPANRSFRFLSWIPNLNLLLAHPGVKLFVNHGGGNSMNEGLFFRKPQVLLPVWLDCFDFAIQCNDAGAGVAITTGPKLNENEFHRAVKKVLFDEGHERFAQQAEAIGRQMQQLGGSNKAAKVLRALLDSLVQPQPGPEPEPESEPEPEPHSELQPASPSETLPGDVTDKKAAEVEV